MVWDHPTCRSISPSALPIRCSQAMLFHVATLREAKEPSMMILAFFVLAPSFRWTFVGPFPANIQRAS